MTTPESTIAPVREMARKIMVSPSISTARKARSVSKPFAVIALVRIKSPARSFPPDPATK